MFKEKYKPLIKMSKYISFYKKEFIISIIYGIFNSVFALLTVLTGAYIASAALFKMSTGKILYLFIPLIIFIIGKGLFAFLEMYECHLVSYGVIEKIRNLLYDSISKTAPQSTGKKRSGSITSVFVEDVEATEVFYAHTAGSYIIAVVCTVLYLTALSFLSFKISAAVFAACILVAAVPYFFNPITKKIGEEIRDGLAEVNAEAVDTVQGLREILIFGKEKKYIEKVTADTLRLNKKEIRDGRFKGLHSLVINLITSAVLISTILLAHSEVIAGSLKPEMVSVVIIFSLFAFVPIMSVSVTAGAMNISNGAAKRILDILEEEPAVKDRVPYIPQNKSSVKGNIEFKDVKFSYEKGTEVLHGVNFTVKAGESIALTGESGAGKSTIANLLMRFYEPDSGAIYIDGKNIKDIHQNSLRDIIAYVPQDVYLFNKTIKENISLACPDASDEEIKQAAKVAMADGFIKRLEQGYDTNVGERGVQLSGGEKQRIAIARAVLKNSPILLMDEAVSNLDSESEALFRQALNNIRKNKTIITIAHRPSTIKEADRVVKIENGKIV
ncbi:MULTISPECIES: thiol reductant ABC exporter subunit CydC [Treponema]|uniref:ABC transporter, ATP-binding/permease protein n=1 Tax=Treponema denticola (strain ATCC 35405 / DSM 14222 / CIP 103919 / JCM 8153 / KCTC 15104) TaxID=243275 RepID=Q73JV0_TREDE|nr:MULTISPECIES: thiol reductant ABC exporter subunit CydC [Treponema]AAS13028.1 ABC transporter, ATP-binding/permease protein [Treponema denticola ATCC 35405]EMB37925.1 thiol reductant ABC exporter, CydC subunit [Treponema denticola ATCC 35404]EMB39992.1 thiol reductant ABC exporter, CydC subunit [Treponema denticola ATCC 33521]HCY94207.1 thiol reductant ABC exporter subunit CydC [Treponema sp.]